MKFTREQLRRVTFAVLEGMRADCEAHNVVPHILIAMNPEYARTSVEIFVPDEIDAAFVYDVLRELLRRADENGTITIPPMGRDE